MTQESGTTATDELLDAYYRFFNAAHPCVLPRQCLELYLISDPLGLKLLYSIMQFIGSLYLPSISSAAIEVQVLEALAEDQVCTAQSIGYRVQALVLYSIAVFWRDEINRGLALLDQAIFEALGAGMNLQEFATKHGCGSPILEESWRRTWWLIYTTDGHVAGSTHSFLLRTTNITSTVDLPCEEEDYELMCVPNSRTLSEFDMREFTDNNGEQFLSFAQLVGLVRSLDTVFSNGRKSDPSFISTLTTDFDASIMGWYSLLPQSKRKLLRTKGKLDEQLSRANMLINTYLVVIHRPLSDLAYCAVESVSRCAPPPPAGYSSPDENHASETHTPKILHGIEAFNNLLTLSSSLKAHTPFIICMIAVTTITHLSACKYVLRGQALKLARERIRLNMGILKALGESWPLGERTYREVGVIAREILCLVDQEIFPPPAYSCEHNTSFSMANQLTFDFDSVTDLVNTFGFERSGLSTGVAV
ncbi:uncharacterized protein KY384_007627 [Bacidia gigantensis]|uniref:uncharacterized protein n=1 Tax=Bacidia gigantensis TaxID=2732470 RepID=UPI001D04A611|nr:uncharacterized protein KY384_007627 [Bacidia gigantensis]KAG8527475.1 hypothetical protein KY384_007627 [Bacidia gigantensis]